MSKRVLIIDDLSFMRNLLRDILEKSGHQVVAEAENGRDGIEKYFLFEPDVVLMDISMPVMDGLQALEQIRKKAPQSKIIMCSAMGQDETIMRAIRLGARDFVVKPFKPERISSAVGRA